MSAVESRYRFRLIANAEEFLHRKDRNDSVSNCADMCDIHDGLYERIDVFHLRKDFNLDVFRRPVVGEEIRMRAKSSYSGNGHAMDVNSTKFSFQYFHYIRPDNGHNAFQFHVLLLGGLIGSESVCC